MKLKLVQLCDGLRRVEHCLPPYAGCTIISFAATAGFDERSADNSTENISQKKKNLPTSKTTTTTTTSTQTIAQTAFKPSPRYSLPLSLSHIITVEHAIEGGQIGVSALTPKTDSTGRLVLWLDHGKCTFTPSRYLT